jgi:hypothetical protein
MTARGAGDVRRRVEIHPAVMQRPYCTRRYCEIMHGMTHYKVTGSAPPGYPLPVFGEPTLAIIGHDIYALSMWNVLRAGLLLERLTLRLRLWRAECEIVLAERDLVIPR